jgi:hypothetical protein
MLRQEPIIPRELPVFERHQLPETLDGNNEGDSRQIPFVGGVSDHSTAAITCNECGVVVKTGAGD